MMSFFIVLLILLLSTIINGQTCSGISKAVQKEMLVERLLDAKAKSGKTFDQIAEKIGLTNAYTAQLFMNQAQLKPATAILLKEVVPDITDEDIAYMKKEPFRSFNPTIMQEPMIYRFVEAMQHYGEGLKALINERKGDGILSAIDIYVNLDIIKGTMDEDRIVITLNGKFLPHVEQLVSNNTAIVTGKRG